MLQSEHLEQSLAHSGCSINIHRVHHWMFKEPCAHITLLPGQNTYTHQALLLLLWVCTYILLLNCGSQKLGMLPRLPTFAEYASLLKIHFGPISRTKFMSRNTDIHTVKIEIPLR